MTRDDEARRAVDRAARTSYGRLVAFLSARTRDLAAAEDALHDAFVAALARWPTDGVPDRPEAWLLTAARRRLTDGARRALVRDAHAPTIAAALEEAAATSQASAFPDERLGLLFACAHPAIDATARTPLMLQAVLGLDAATIAAAFLTAPAAMGQRLVRAKGKIRDAGIPFAEPDPAELSPRLEAVLEAIYAAYGTAWDAIGAGDDGRRALALESVWLARLLVDMLPDPPEPRGLLALLLHCEARRGTRRGADGCFVPLDAQDPAGWDAGLIADAEAQLAVAVRAGRPGRFQLEAAIQSAHAARARTGRTDWRAIATLYDGLVRLAPTVGGFVARAAAIGAAHGAEAGLRALDELPAAAVASYQPHWAVRAALLRRAGHDASAAYARAIGLTGDPAVRAYLRAVAGG